MPRSHIPPDESREPDDFKEAQRLQSVGARGDEHEDIEESRLRRARDASDDTDDETLAEEELVDVVDLDRMAEGEGPDA